MELEVAKCLPDSRIYGGSDGLSNPKSKHFLDDLVDTTALIKRALVELDGSRKEEIERVNNAAYHRKQALQRETAVIKNELLQIEKALSRSDDVELRLLAEKKKASMTKALKIREQSLFMDTVRVDVEAEAAVKKLEESANLVAKIDRMFAIKFIGSAENGQRN
jgi:hypothetical protein